MPTPPTLPAGATLGKSFEYGVDLNTGTTAVPVWQPVRRMFGFQPSPSAVTSDAQTYDDFGAPNADVSGWAWSLAWSMYVYRVATTGMIAEAKALFDRQIPEAKGDAAVIEARWYHKPEDDALIDADDAFQGFATVGLVRANVGAEGGNEQWNVTLTGKGPHASITNPWAGWTP